MDSINFLADKVRISGPLVDGSYNITFSVGEYQAKNVSELLRLPQNIILKVNVSEGE
jgi:hypothetical protein